MTPGFFVLSPPPGFEHLQALIHCLCSGDESNAAPAQDGAQRSAQRPATHLPPEILSHIFSILSSIDQPARPYGKKGSLGWLTATHVCRRWRSVALGDPSLWASNIILPFALGARWADTFIARAQGASLVITRPQDVSPSPILPTNIEFDFLRANLARTQVLRLDANATHLHALCTPAPLLHTLDIRHLMSGLYRMRPGAAVNSPPILSKDLFGGSTGAPALRHLRVETQGPLPWTSPLLAGLKSLDLRHRSRPVAGAEATEMFTVLGGMPALEKLALQLQLGAPETAPQPVVALAALRELALQTTVASACHILARVALPATASVRCELSCFGGPCTQLPALLSTAAASIDVRASLVARIQVMPTGNTKPWAPGSLSVDVTAWRADTPALTLSFMDDALLKRGLLAGALAALASAHLEVLVVGSDGSDDAWLAALQGAHALRSVTVARRAGQQFCVALAVAPAGFLPALAELEVQDVDFGVGGAGAGDGLAQALAQGLEQRVHARGGCALRVLKLTGCTLDGAEVRRLREAVPGMEVTCPCA
ncbi:hypothetical protein FA95DRAFT_1402026 [Auriscalpium vulgare]|uniref:Uncharacterized protein n=1 Tax=Auriscalpium vulgare TaxID=40419 RepID=A0ACB8RRL6_9AGAM|nr:hypothetical protein FA95DRAFT_1402026 [Auriscalpium vulgare]